MTILTSDIVAWWSLTKKGLPDYSGSPFSSDPDKKSGDHHSLSPAVAAVAVTAPFLSVLTPEYTQSV